MDDLSSVLDRHAVRQAALELGGLALAAALLLSFGYALAQGLSQPDIAGEEVLARVRGFMAGPVYVWVLRVTVALLALLEGWLLARRLSDRDASALPETFAAVLAALLAVVLVRLGLDLLFGVPVTLSRLLLDALLYAAALGLALLGAALGGQAGAAAPDRSDQLED